MARTKNFDREEKLLLAMELFWQQGYADTSVSDLVNHLGINRFSLYNTYVDKESLYREALDYYLKKISFPMKKHDSGYLLSFLLVVSFG